MADDQEPHFSDEELEAALAGFEKEFAQERETASPVDQPTAGADGAADADKKNETDAGLDPASIEIPDDAAELDPSVGFDAELAGLLGNRAKIAVVVTRIADADLLAAFCQLADISADCIGSNQGAVAVLRNLDGDSPEAAARDLTTVVAGMTVILAVNRADKLEVTLYVQGEAARTFAPPMLFTSTARFVEDLLLGITTVNALREQGFEIEDSADFDHKRAMATIAKHTKFGRGGSTKGSSIN
ncbi:hypothetical protein [Bifidobacterium eulemuris]|uniref:Uncharacterized protein n=1 Tax=Bifidobacterium eulemuris TaxID=1765219 RepID=A0A261G826_9BIFI|nr:hypothetical protein [Bifidobacterium eulemuris]OZG67353.1 hypothetical protein BEUL_1444 [Bifidobacterium eulemuris]QOL32931.1 hypothetical protein BE0216_11140 [Bifidobacterium eulemuris]